MSEQKQASSKITIGTLTDECYKRIKHDILVGNLAWGEKLNVISIAEHYGISRSPVIKAIDRLAMEQLVRIIPNIGSFVLIPTKEDVKEVFEIRMMLETTMCRLAYQKHRDRLLAAMRETEEMLDRKENINSKSQFESFLEYDRSFHLLFPNFAGNERLSNYYDSIRNQVELFRTHTYFKSYVDLALDRHANILDLLTNDKLNDGISLLEKHIAEVEAEILESIEKTGVPTEYK